MDYSGTDQRRVASGDPAAGMEKPTDPRVARTEAAINQAFLKLLEKKSYEDISVLDIVGMSNVHKATFFRNYKNKDDVLYRLAFSELSDLVNETFSIMYENSSYESCRTFCEYIDHRRTLWSVLLTGGAAPILLEEWRRLIGLVSAKNAPHDHWKPVALAIRCSIGTLSESIVWWLSEAPEDVDVDAMAKILDKIIRVSAAPMILGPRG